MNHKPGPTAPSPVWSGLAVACAALVLPLPAQQSGEVDPSRGAASRPVQPRPTAVGRALQWLRAHQDEDGKWDCDGFMKHDEAGKPCDGAGRATHDIGVTALAVLAFLGDGSTLRSGPYKPDLKAAIRWLRNNQQDNGLFGSDEAPDFIYDHAIATYAMCEAYGLSSYTLLKSTAQKGLDYLEAHRNSGGVWRYRPGSGESDTSVTTWALLACWAGQSFGLSVNQAAFTCVGEWYDKVTDADGRVGYTKMGEPGSRHPGDHASRFPRSRCETLTAMALFGRLLIGQDPEEHPSMLEGARLVRSKLPRWDATSGSIDEVYWFFGGHAMFQIGGESWRAWSGALRDQVGAHQRLDANARGSWDPVGVWGEDGGRVAATALNALALQSGYRYGRLKAR
ncbi:MAG: prenyltransferase/squalene oxidase repeat-containing protein [Planctomycetota bacterium]|nr:prenyltransferase/squalene oxidase repeat-containing protein [Planctomycetota bacterium]